MTENRRRIAAGIVIAALLVAMPLLAWANGSPEIEIEGTYGPIADGGSEDQGAKDPGQQTSFTFSITNAGSSELTGGPIVVSNESNVSVDPIGPVEFSLPAGGGDVLRISLAYTPLSFAPFSFQVSIENNDPDEDPYVFTVTGIGQTTVPEIEIEGTGGPIADGATVNEGAKPAGVGQVFTFSIRNAGSRTLNGSFNGPTNPVNVTLMPMNRVDFILPPGDDVITIDVGYTPDSSCPFSFDLVITSDDADENPFNITVRGSDDTEAPVISCPADINVECGDPYTPAQTGQATATDNCTPEQDIVITWSDAITPAPNGAGGTVVRTWTATDLWGNASSCDQTLSILDTMEPDIVLVGANPVVLELGTPYTEWGATVTDACCVLANALVIDASDLDESTPGTYTVKYDAEDCAGNAATTVTRTVQIVDTTAPQILIRVPEQGAEYLLHEVVLVDWSVIDLAEDVVISASANVGEPIDTSRPGWLTFTVSAVDGSGNLAEETVEYAVRYRIHLDTEPSSFELAPLGEEGAPSPVPPVDPIVLAMGDPIHLEFQLLDAFGEPVGDAIPTLTVARVTPDTDPEAREILWLQIIEFDAETSSYTCNVSIGSSALPAPGLYDLWIGLGDGRNLHQRVLVEPAG